MDGAGQTGQSESLDGLHQRLAMYEAIFQATPLAMLVLDERGMVVSCNPAVETTFGWAPEELVGQSVTVLIAEVAPEVHNRALRRYLAGELPSTPWGRNARARRRDGSEFLAACSVTTLPADGSPGRRVLGVLVDMTERLEAEERLRVLQKNHALGTLVAGLAHNFNNLLTSVIGPIHIVQENTPPGDERAYWLDIAAKASGEATLLVKDLMALCRPGTASVGSVDAVQVARETVDLVSAASGRRMQYTLHAEADVPRAHATTSGLQQVLLNLLTNSRDAVLERMERDPGLPGEVHVALAGDLTGDHVTISVRDNGVGVPREIRDRIFDPFFTTKPPEKGSGLGLSTLATLVRQFGGTVAVEDAPGGGAAFVVRLQNADRPPLDPGGTPATDRRAVPLADRPLSYALDRLAQSR
ncbi:MAG: ATP-binding protein [Dehalococcoidia bacterium]